MGRSAKPRKSKIRGRSPRPRVGDPGVIAKTASKPRGKFTMTWRVATGFAPNLDAVALVDHISDAVLAEHLFAIQEGLKADGSALQEKLRFRGKQGVFAREGQRPNIRGFTGLTSKPFSDNIERSGIKVASRAVRLKRSGRGGTRAKSKVQPDRLHRNFTKFESERGHEYFYKGGNVEKTVDVAIKQWLELALVGELADGDTALRKAKKSNSL